MWKKWIIRILLLLVLLIALLSAYVYFKKDTLKANAIEGINSVLDAQVEVNGLIDITFLSTFPSITLELQDVFIADKFKSTDTLANLSKVNLIINPLSLFGETISFKSISLSDGKVHLKTFKDGKSNYDIVKKNPENVSDTSKHISIALEEIIVSNIDLTYDDLKAKVYFDTYINDATASGNFEDKDFNLFVDVNTDAKILDISGTQFLNKNKVKANFDLTYESENKCISFQENIINVDDNNFSAIGSICTETNTINLEARSKGDNLENALKLIPKDLFQLDNISGNGKYEIEVLLTEKLNKPSIIVNFELEEADAQIDEVDINFSELYAQGTFKNRPQNNIILKDFAFKAGKSNLKGNLFLPNLKEKKMQLKANGTIFSEELKKFENQVINFEKSGKINLDNLNLNFNFREKDSLWIASKLTGEIGFEKLSGEFLKIEQPFSLNGKFKAIGKKISVNGLAFNVGENDIEFTGTLTNALNYFQDNIFKTNDALSVQGKLKSKYFDINSFLKNKDDETKKEEIPDLLKWLNLSVNLDLQIDELIYKKLIVNNVSSKIKSNKAGTFNFLNLNANSVGGNAKGNVELRFFNDKTLEVSLVTKLKEIDINKLFIAFENFDQKAITNKNIRGKVDANLLVSMAFKNFTAFQKKDLIVHSDFVINDGELIKLESLKSLSKYLSIEQLEHIYFNQYKSSITIVDQVLNLKKSIIKSNLITLEMGGTHSFDNKIDYIMKLNLNNVLAAKFKKNKTLDKDYVNDIMGGINLFISMKGTVSDPKIKLEKRSAFKETVKENKKEKIDIKEVFKQENPPEKEEKEFYFEEDEEEFIDFDEE